MNTPVDRYRPSVRALADEVRSQHGGVNAQIVMRAYDYAAAHHQGEVRLNGEPYLSHPVAVARIAAQILLDHTLIAAALLHDTVDRDSGDEEFQRLRVIFDHDIVDLVDAAAATDRARDASTLPEDLDRRLIVLKLADRLHNLHTIDVLRREKQLSKARHTLDVLVPLAERSEIRLGGALRRAAVRTIADAGQGQLAHPPKQPSPRTVSGSMVSFAGLLLPQGARQRWVEEWRAELASIPRSTSRLRFALDVLCGAPSLAAISRVHHPGRTP